MEHIAAVQALVIGCLFAWAGTWKVFSPRARRLVGQSALGKILPIPVAARAAHFAVGASELALAAVLLAVPPMRWWAIRMATVFALGFLIYLGVAWRIAPDRPCACMGGRASKISWRSLVRSAVLLLFTLMGWSSPEYWGEALFTAPLVAFVAGAEVGVLWLLSLEFGRVGPRLGRHILRRVVVAAGNVLDPDCARMPPDWDGLERKLRATPVFHQLVPLHGSRTDAWKEGCWRFMTFQASFQDRPATAVFAVPAIIAPMLFNPEAVSASLVDDLDGTILARTGWVREEASPVGEASAM